MGPRPQPSNTNERPAYAPPTVQPVAGQQAGPAPAAASPQPDPGTAGLFPLPPQNGAPPAYDFIMNPQQPKRPPLFRFGNASSKVRIALLAGAVVLLLILVIGFKNMLAAGNNFIPSMVTVAQDQYELVHLAAGGVQNAVDDNTRNFAVTAQASLQSQQNDTVAYLAGNGRKVKTKELAAKLSKPLDSRLSDALAASNYDSTFRDIMKSSLTAYQHDLQQAYRQDTGPKGRAMLNDYYKAAGLLLKQLGS